MTQVESILDQDPPERNGIRPAFSYASVAFGIISWGLIISGLCLLSNEIKVSEALPISTWFPTAIKLSFVLGLACSICGFIRKEPNTFWKWTGVVINGLILLSFFGIGLFINLISCKK